MRIRAWFLIASCMFLTACSDAPDAYPVPLQRPGATGPERAAVARFVNLGDPDADAYIVRDIQDTAQGTGWRWTYERPELRFLLQKTKGQKFSIDFSFPAPNFKDTGPVTVSFFINGHLLDKVRYTTPGDKHFAKEVPEAWLQTDSYTTVMAVVDPPWIAPTDKARLGFVLTRAGFVD